MFLKRALAAATLTAIFGSLVPAAPALADGAASTRNILLGIGAATYLVIQHNRKVHEKYAEDARRQAELQSENHDAWAAYSSEKRANDSSLAEITDLKREVSYQHNVITSLQHQVSVAQHSGYIATQQTAYATSPAHARSRAQRAAARPPSNSVAMVSYGWGQL